MQIQVMLERLNGFAFGYMEHETISDFYSGVERKEKAARLILWKEFFQQPV